MNPYTHFASVHQHVFTVDEIHWSRYTNEVRGLRLPVVNTLYFATELPPAYLDSFNFRYPKRQGWISGLEAQQYGIYFDVIAPTTAVVKPQDLMINAHQNRLVIAFPSIQIPQEFKNSLILRLRSQPLFFNTSIVTIRNHQLITSAPTFRIEQNDFLMVDGHGSLGYANYIDTEYFNNRQLLIMHDTKLYAESHVAGEGPFFADIGGKEWYIFDLNLGNGLDILPVSEGLVFIAGTQIGHQLGCPIPLTKIKQLSHSVFAIDKAFVDDYVATTSSTAYTLAYVRDASEDLPRLSVKYDACSLHLLQELTKLQRREQLLGVASQQIPAWMGRALLDAPQLMQIGRMSDPFQPTMLLNAPTNPYYSDPTTGHRFACTTYREVKDGVGDTEVVLLAKQDYPTHILVYTEQGYKLENALVYNRPSANQAELDLNDVAQFHVEVLDATPFTDHFVMALAGEEVNLLSDKPLRIFKMVDTAGTSQASLCGDLVYHTGWQEVPMATLGECCEDKFIFNDTVATDTYLFTYDQGFAIQTLEFTELLDDFQPILFKIEGQNNVPCLYGDVIVFYNGKELVQDVEFIVHSATQGSVQYGLEVYLTNVPEDWDVAKVEVIIQRNLHMERASTVLLPETASFASGLLRAYTQVTINGLSSKGSWHQDGSLMADEFYGSLAQARMMIPKHQLGLLPSAELRHTRQVLADSKLSMETSKLLAVHSLPQVLDLHKQKLIGEAWILQLRNIATSTFESQETYQAWVERYKGYAAVTQRVRQHPLVDYLQFTPSRNGMEVIPPLLHKALEMLES
jgi:hypothetical protein